MAVIKIPTMLRLSVETHCEIQRIARVENRSLSNMVDFLIKNEIKRYEHQHGEIILNDEDLSLM